MQNVYQISSSTIVTL